MVVIKPWHLCRDMLTALYLNENAVNTDIKTVPYRVSQ